MAFYFLTKNNYKDTSFSEIHFFNKKRTLESTLLCKNYMLSIVWNLNSKQVNSLPARTFITTRNAGGAYTPDLMGGKVVLVVGIPHLS